MPDLQSIITKVRRRLRPAYALYKLKRGAMLTPATRHLAITCVRGLLPAHAVAGLTRLPEFDVRGAAAALTRDGFVRLGKLLSDKEVDDLLAYSGTLQCFDGWPQLGTEPDRFRPHDPPPTCHTAHFEKADLARSQEVMSIVNDRTILGIAHRFLGATPTISNMAMWWSYAGRGAAKEAQKFHRDYDDLKFLKLFVYLTDVDMTSGPHVYVRGSADARGFTHPGSYAVRYDDDTVVRSFGNDNIQHFCEPKGHAFLVDTFGLHKGLLPVSRDRLLLQAQYSLFPTGYDTYPESGRAAKSGAWDDYVNRLNFKR